MAINLTCPECAAALKITTPPTAGKKIRCPSCKAIFSPSEDATPPPKMQPTAEERLAARPMAPPPRRVERDRADDDDDDVRERRPFRKKKSHTGLLIGLLAGGGALLLLCAGGGVVAMLLFRTSRVPSGGNPVMAQAGNEPIVVRNAPPNDPNPIAPDPIPGHNVPNERHLIVPDPGVPQVPPPGRWNGGLTRFRDDQIITVVVTGVQDDKIGNYLRDKLASQLPPGNSSTRSRSSGGVMEVALAPIGDPQTFAKKIDFGTVERVAGRVVYMTVKGWKIPAPVPRRKHEPPSAGDLPDLVGYWSFDEGKGTEAANAAGSRKPALLHNAAWKPGVRGQCLSFNGPDSYLDLGTAADLNFPAHAAFTVSFWVQPAKSSGTFVSLRNSEDESAVLDIALGGGPVNVTLRPDGNLFGPVTQLSGGKVDDGEWHQVLLQRRADDHLELYVDGDLVKDAVTNGGPLTTNMRALGRERFWLEKKPSIGDPHYVGCMDELCVFKRALTAEEIRKLAGQD
jgi:predicted Zn finger-like uncharacterized protein